MLVRRMAEPGKLCESGDFHLALVEFDYQPMMPHALGGTLHEGSNHNLIESLCQTPKAGGCRTCDINVFADPLSGFELL